MTTSARKRSSPDPGRPPRTPTGRPRFEPTDRMRGLVEGYASVGTPQPMIARVIGIDAKTLRKHFRDELDLSAARAIARVKQGLFFAATHWMKQGPGGGISGTPSREGVSAAIFLCKTLGGLSEARDPKQHDHKHEHEHSGKVAVAADAAVIESAKFLDELAARLASGPRPQAGLAAHGAAEADRP